MANAPRPRRVFITGIGVLTAIGTGLPAFRAGLRAGTSPVQRIDRFDPAGFRSQVAAQVDDFVPLDHMDARAVRGLDRFSQFGLATGRMAMADAGIVPGGRGAPSPDRVGIYLGSALGGIAFAESQHEQYLARGLRGVSPTLALAVFGGAAPADLGIALDVRGPILSTANSCASGAVAIGEALNAIRSGEIDAAVAGGVDCPLSPLAFGAFDLIRALSAGRNDDPGQAARPMDAGRDGFVMGEGAALLVIESEASVRGTRRDAVRGGPRVRRNLRCAPRRPAAPGGIRGRPRSLHRAGGCRDRTDEIDWVSAHASSTPIGDIAEARALVLALGARAATVPVSATKALTGHPLGATGAIEAAMAALAIRDGWVPGTCSLVAPEPELAELLPGLLHDGKDGRYERVLSTSFGFGGLNAALVLGVPSS